MVVAYESLKAKEKSSRVIPEVVALAYGSGRLHESLYVLRLFITKFKSQFKRGFTKVVVTRTDRLRDQSGRKESFDCIHLYCRYSENMLLWTMELSEVSGENALTFLTFITSDPTKTT